MAGLDDISDPETAAAMNEFDFLVSEVGEGAGEARSGDGEWGELVKSNILQSECAKVIS